MSAPSRRQPATAAAAAALAMAMWLAPVAGLATARPDVTIETSLTATPDADGWVRLAIGSVDYAPAGLPDFDQRQANWFVVDPQRKVWTHDGPVAVANALWWLDSLHEPDPRPPLEPADGFALVQAHGDWDDHDPANVAPVVSDLAVRSGTNGPLRRVAVGTCLEQLRDGLNERLSGARTDPRFVGRIVDRPTVQELAEPIGLDEPVVLLLGLWQEHEMVGWRRIGGHYVSLEAVDRAVGRLRISDPFRDTAGTGDGPAVHNDAREVSHDMYMVSPSLRPGPVLRLDGYLDDSADSTAFVTNFAGLNGRNCSEADDPWLIGARLEAQIEAALVLVAEAVPTVSPTAPATATEAVATSAPVTTTATATATATSAATATETTTPTGSPTSTSPATATATASPLPSSTVTPSPTGTALSTATQAPTAAPPPPTAGPHPGSVCGRVRGAGGQDGLTGAHVTALRDGLGVAETWSGADGQYCLFDLAPGAYLLRAERATCAPATVPVTVTGGLARVDLVLSCPRGGALLPMLLVQRPRARGR